jgi:Glu-tRNA(Gln) amidotransferase subunit E-like FAD-binding protein
MKIVNSIDNLKLQIPKKKDNFKISNKSKPIKKNIQLKETFKNVSYKPQQKSSQNNIDDSNNDDENEPDIENFFNGIHYQNKSMNRSDQIKENFNNDYVQENFYNDTKSTNGLEHFGNINHNPVGIISDINVYTKWLQNNRKNYHNLNKVHVENLFKVMRGHKLTQKEIPESFVILREGEEDIDNTQKINKQEITTKSSTCGCGK